MVAESELIRGRVKATKCISEAEAPHNGCEGSSPLRAVLRGETPRTPGVNPRVQRVVAISEKKYVDTIRETDLRRRGGAREEGCKGGGEPSIGGSLLTVRGRVRMKTNEKGVLPMNFHADHKTAAARVSVEKGVISRRDGSGDP